MIAPRISKIQVCHETGDARIQFEASITKCFSGTCVRYAVLANAGLACASICQGRLLRLWFWKAWRLSLASNRRERGGREAVREAISRVLNLCEQDGYRLKAFQAWARSVATAHCSWEVEVGRLAIRVYIHARFVTFPWWNLRASARNPVVNRYCSDLFCWWASCIATDNALCWRIPGAYFRVCLILLVPMQTFHWIKRGEGMTDETQIHCTHTCIVSWAVAAMQK